VLKMKDSSAAPRSAIGVLDNHNILLAVAETPILLKDWAGLLQKQATNVLNLDGGGSSQISVKTGDFSLQVSGDTGVPNAIGIFPK